MALAQQVGDRGYHRITEYAGVPCLMEVEIVGFSGDPDPESLWRPRYVVSPVAGSGRMLIDPVHFITEEEYRDYVEGLTATKADTTKWWTPITTKWWNP
jgi:hypothetical protein